MAEKKNVPGRSELEYRVPGCLFIISGMLLYLMGALFIILTPGYGCRLHDLFLKAILILFYCWTLMGVMAFPISFLGLAADFMMCMAVAAVVSSSIREIMTGPGRNMLPEIKSCLLFVALSGVIAVTVFYLNLLVLFPRNRLYGNTAGEPARGHTPQPLVIVAVMLQATAMLQSFRLLSAWHDSAVPIFIMPGSYIAGNSVLVAMLVIIAAALLLAVGVLKQQRTAWWGLLASLILSTLYCFLKVRSMNPAVRGRALGIPGTLTPAIQNPHPGLLPGLICFGFIIAALFLLLWLRKFFRKDTLEPEL